MPRAGTAAGPRAPAGENRSPAARFAPRPSPARGSSLRAQAPLHGTCPSAGPRAALPRRGLRIRPVEARPRERGLSPAPGACHPSGHGSGGPPAVHPGCDSRSPRRSGLFIGGALIHATRVAWIERERGLTRGAAPQRDASGVQAKWQGADAGPAYAETRFRSPRARDRDARLLARVARRAGATIGEGTLLDAPCGTGRMHGAATRVFGARGSYVGADVSASMLGQFEREETSLVRASLFDLPFPDAAFTAVISCRFLHHHGAAHERDARRAALGELARVAARWVFASYWDIASLRGRRAATRSRAGTRNAGPWSELAADLADVGLTPRARAFSLRFVSAQTWFAAERVGLPTGRARGD